MPESVHESSTSPPDDYGISGADLDATGEEKPYHSKRPHKKSRTGCKNCKARKVKCDEARPTCRSCRLRKTECVYPPPPQTKATATAATSYSSSEPATSSATPSAATVQTIAASSPSTENSPFPPDLLPTHGFADIGDLDDIDDASALDPDFVDHTIPYLSSPDATSKAVAVIQEPLFRPSPSIDELDMRLLWFYTTDTSASFSIGLNQGYSLPVNRIMRTRLVQHAFENQFLMDSLFALSALHLQALGQPIDNSRAISYRAKSFEGYRRAVESATPDSLPALISNSLILTAISSQHFREPDCKDLYIIDWMIVWRGISLMINMMGFPAFSRSDIHSLFHRPPMDLEQSSYYIPNRLLFMISSIPTWDDDFSEVQIYYDTLKYLGALYFHLREGLGPVMKLRIVTWFTFLPRKFADLARERRPRALVILGYYSAFLKLTTDVWWMREVGQRSLRDICRFLGPDWADLLAVPLVAINVDSHVELARLILEDPTWALVHKGGRTTEEELVAALNSLTWVNNLGNKVSLDEMDEEKPFLN